MPTQNSIQMPDVSATADISRTIAPPEMIDRLATEMRARSGGELPHAFYVEQVRRQLAGKLIETAAANAEPARDIALQPSVFHSWALSE